MSMPSLSKTFISFSLSTISTILLAKRTATIRMTNKAISRSRYQNCPFFSIKHVIYNLEDMLTEPEFAVDILSFFALYLTRTLGNIIMPCIGLLALVLYDITLSSAGPMVFIFHTRRYPFSSFLDETGITDPYACGACIDLGSLSFTLMSFILLLLLFFRLIKTLVSTMLFPFLTLKTLLPTVREPLKYITNKIITINAIIITTR